MIKSLDISTCTTEVSRTILQVLKPTAVPIIQPIYLEVQQSELKIKEKVILTKQMGKLLLTIIISNKKPIRTKLILSI
jgi:hypothetical protein